MNDHEKDRLRRRIEEVAALSVDDHRHQEVFRETSEAGTWAEQYWLELLRRDEKLRLLLRHAHPPEDLQERLLEIPSTTVLSHRNVRRALVCAGVAASLIVGAWLGLPVRRTGPTLTEAARSLATLVAIDHVKRPKLTIKTAISSEIITHLNAAVKFPISIPALGEEYALLGGRVCKFDTRPIVYTRWRRRGQEYSLYQVSPKDFDLPREFQTQVVSISAKSKESVGHLATIWTEGNCVFALVCENKQGNDEGESPTR